MKINENKINIIKILIALSCMLSGCGGGGGGTGSSDSDFSGGSSVFATENSRSASTGIRVLHGVIDGAPVDLWISGKNAPAATARFALAYPYVNISGTQIVSVVPHKALSPNLFNSEISLGKNERGTILLYGNNEYLGVNSVYLADVRPPELAKSSAAIRVIHAIVGAAQVDASTSAGSNPGAASFGRASAYAEVPAGITTLTVSRTVDKQTLYSGSIDLMGGKSYSLFLVGDVGYYRTSKLLED